jgi:nicotinate phosphoribosyltransferase
MIPEPHPPVSLWPDPTALGTLTDLYQITMMAGYHREGMEAQPATFELFARKLPPGRAYLVFAGLEQALGDLLNLKFSAEETASIRRLPMFSHIGNGFFDYLRTVRFEGDLWAVPEGTVVFPGEPLIRVTAPLAQAQWVETLLLASVGYPTLVASKAARIVNAAKGKPLLEFGARRGQGPHAGFLAARAAYIAGFVGTSHVEAARRLGIPASGTMAHSWVQSFPTEQEAFAAYSRTFPNSTTLLVDTYDTLQGVRNAAAIEPPVKAIRIDSGDLDMLSRQSRKISTNSRSIALFPPERRSTTSESAPNLSPAAMPRRSALSTSWSS